MRPIFLNPPRLGDIAVAAIGVIGSLAILILVAYDVGHKHGKREGMAADNCAPIVVYRRGVDTHSPEELRRIARFRERAV